MTPCRLRLNATLSILLGAAVLMGVGATSAEDMAEAKTIVVTPFKGGAGAGQSKWYGPVRLSNTSFSEAADGIVYVLPQQSNDFSTAPQFEYHVPARRSLIIENLWQYFVDLGDPQPDFGNVSLRVEPTDEIDISVAAIVKNEQNLNEDNAALIDPNNTTKTTTDLLQGLRGIGDSEIFKPGDFVTIMAPSVQLQEYGDPVQTKEMNRMNVFFYGQPDDFDNDPQVFCELYSSDGTPSSSRWIDLNRYGGSQITNFIENGMGRTPLGNEIILCTVTRGEVFVLVSVAKNNVDLLGVDDAYTIEPEVSRLVEEEQFSVSPPTIEANDPWAAYAKIKSRSGTEVTTLWIDLIGRTNGNSTNELIGSGVSSGTVAGTYDVEGHYTVRSEYGDFERNLPTRQLEILAEQDGYVASKADAEAYILASADTLRNASLWASYGLAGGWATAPSDWENPNTGWPSYFDGINDPQNENLELDHLVFDDDAGGYTGNAFTIYFTNGQMLGVGGLPEKEFDQFRTLTNAQQP